MSADLPDFIETTEEAMHQFDEHENLDEAKFEGRVGFHTFYSPDGPSDLYGVETALHTAIDQALMEISLDEEVVRENRGEITPRAVRDEFVEQVDSLIGGDVLLQRIADNLEQQLAERDDDE